MKEMHNRSHAILGESAMDEEEFLDINFALQQINSHKVDRENNN